MQVKGNFSAFIKSQEKERRHQTHHAGFILNLNISLKGNKISCLSFSFLGLNLNLIQIPDSISVYLYFHIQAGRRQIETGKQPEIEMYGVVSQAEIKQKLYEILTFNSFHLNVDSFTNV
jgi:hypothetical protein